MAIVRNLVVTLLFSFTLFVGHPRQVKAAEILEFRSDDDVSREGDSDSFRRVSSASSFHQSSSTQTNNEETAVSFILEHAFGSHAFRTAGKFSAKLKSSNGVKKLRHLHLSRNALSDEEKISFKDLVLADGYYRVRIPSNVLKSDIFVVSSTKARCLAAANFREHFELLTDGQGHIQAINYNSDIDCPVTSQAEDNYGWIYNSSVAVSKSKQAERLIPAYEELEQSSSFESEPLKPGEKPKKPEEPKTFWERYWIYCIPLGLVFINALVAGQTDAGGAAPAPAAAGRGPARRR